MLLSVPLDRARMTVSGAPGTGTITLLAAATGYRTFDAAATLAGVVIDGKPLSYVIEQGADSESGQGTYTASGTTLSRGATVSSIIAGVSGTTKLSVTSAAQVYVTVLAADVNVVPAVNSAQATSLSGLSPSYDFQAHALPASSSSAIDIALCGETFYDVAGAAITGGGHLIGSLGRFWNDNATYTLTLAIGAEGKIDNRISGAHITTAISVDCNLGSNISGATIDAWYAAFCDLGSNAGTITTVAFVGCSCDANTGTLGSVYGFLFNNMNSSGTISGNMIGMYFASQTFAGTKYAVFNGDAGAFIYSVGPIIGAGQVTGAKFQLDTGTKTATAAAGAATLNKSSGKITTEALVTAAGASYTLTLTNSQIAAADTVFASLANGTNTTGDPAMGLVTPAAGSVVIIVRNRHITAAFNGTLVISFACMKA